MEESKPILEDLVMDHDGLVFDDHPIRFEPTARR
jgi:hypothetical protein